MNHFTSTIAAQTELAKGNQMPKPTLVSGLPALNSVLAEASPLPSEALFIGIAEDGLPVLLNLQDPIPGPILIAGDQASGKTNLLKMIARAAELIHSPSEIQYAVITQYPEEWNGFQENQINTGIYVAKENNTQELIQSIFDLAHTNKGEAQSILLLIDDLESMKNINPQNEQNLRWLLLRGPSRHVWPIITVNAGSAKNMESWLAFFRTRLFGSILNAEDSNFVAGYANKPPADLTAGSQFAMREGNTWLKFLSPSID